VLVQYRETASGSGKAVRCVNVWWSEAQRAKRTHCDCLLPATDMPLLDRIRRGDANVGVLGALATSGLPLAVELAKVGFDVTGFDVDARRWARLIAGRSYIPDVPAAEVAEVVAAGRLHATTDMSGLAQMDVIDICVPTPLRKTRGSRHVVRHPGRRGGG